MMQEQMLNCYKNNESVLTNAQKEYFRNSQIKNDDGSLQKCNHATKSKFDTFDKSYIGAGMGASFGPGFYFSTDSIKAELDYGHNLEVYLNVCNPLVLDINDNESVSHFALVIGIKVDDIQYWTDFYGNVKSGINKTLKDYYGDSLAENPLKNAGYDGLIILHTAIGVQDNRQDIEKEIVVFEPNQIKAVDNLYPTKDANFRINGKSSEKMPAITPKQEPKIGVHPEKQETAMHHCR